tara:strand:- start:368 stop:829 length:462 start_codon:yes stop_codon:yes gene_type:complete
MDIEDKWRASFAEAQKHFKTADHMAYVSFSILNENRLMIKIIGELAVATSNLIKAFLYYEAGFTRVKLYKDPQRNLKTFMEKIAPSYLDNDVLRGLIRVLEITKKHQDAAVEFVRKDKFVILMGDKYEILTIKTVRELLNLVRAAIGKFPGDV